MILEPPCPLPLLTLNEYFTVAGSYLGVPLVPLALYTVLSRNNSSDALRGNTLLSSNTPSFPTKSQIGRAHV